MAYVDGLRSIDDKKIGKFQFRRNILKGSTKFKRSVKNAPNIKKAKVADPYYYRDTFYKMRIAELNNYKARRLAYENKLAISRHNKNVGLYTSFLFKIFFTLFPLFVVGIMLSSKEDFNFDFFGFVNAFSKFQTNNTYDTLKSFATNISKINSSGIFDNTFFGVASHVPVIGTIFKGVNNINNFLYKLLFITTSISQLLVAMVGDLISNMISFLNVFFNYFII